MKKLDFVCIGAQKAGTTSLFYYLKNHSEICLPKNKEAPYFDKLHPKFKLEEYFKQNFNDCFNRKIVGTITPQYMCFPGSAELLYRHNPELKLIVLLRNPVERLISHYDMCVKRGLILDDFDKHIKSLFNKEAIEQARNIKYSDSFEIEDEKNMLIVWSEYGRILNEYLQYFKLSNFLIIDSENLRNKKQETIKKILDFLNLNPDVTKLNLNENYHKGGKRSFLPSVYKIKNYAIVKNIREYIPIQIKQSSIILNLIKHYDRLITFPNNREQYYSSIYIKILKDYFTKDLIALSPLNILSSNWFKTTS